MDNLRDLFGMMRIDRIPNARVTELCSLKNEGDESEYEGKVY